MKQSRHNLKSRLKIISCIALIASASVMPGNSQPAWSNELPPPMINWPFVKPPSSLGIPTAPQIVSPPVPAHARLQNPNF